MADFRWQIVSKWVSVSKPTPNKNYIKRKRREKH
jgi:hypothetical protein